MVILDLTTNELIWIVFFGVLCVLVLLILVFLLADAIKNKNRSQEGDGKKSIINIYVDKGGKVSTNNAKSIGEVAQPVVKAEPVNEEPVIEPEPQPEPEPISVNGVVLNTKAKKLYADELKEAEALVRKQEKEIRKHFQDLDENIRIKEANFHVLVSFGSYKLCKLAFSRGVLKANFYVASSEFKLYSKSTDSVNVKEKPTTVDLNVEEALEVSFRLADLAFEQAKQAKADRRKNKEE